MSVILPFAVYRFGTPLTRTTQLHVDVQRRDEREDVVVEQRVDLDLRDVAAAFGPDETCGQLDRRLERSGDDAVERLLDTVGREDRLDERRPNSS